jgi:transposase
MLTLPASVRIYVAAEPVDLRRGFDGLAAATRNLMGDPLSGHLFCFLNRRKNRIKLLVWDRTAGIGSCEGNGIHDQPLGWLDAFHP